MQHREEFVATLSEIAKTVFCASRKPSEAATESVVER